MELDETTQAKRDLVAQWAFDTRPLLLRFHLWLDDIEVQWLRGERHAEFSQPLSFLGGRMERLVAMTTAVTALGTQLFGRFGEGQGQDKAHLNRVKKDADAISAYAMSEGLWHATRLLPENHAILVCLGEGLMPKGGETPEMGSNPQLGFGRVYARPEVAQRLDRLVAKLLNDPDDGFEAFYQDLKTTGTKVWGAAIDTLENTSRFAQGAATGPMTVLHLFDQPLRMARPYEGYMGTLILPAEIVRCAADQAVLIDFHTPRARVMEAIRTTYPGIAPQDVHIWTLRGSTRAPRIASLWQQWEQLGAHIIDDGWTLPSGLAAFADSGTYAPTYRVGTWKDPADGRRHLLLVDGYAASAEAVQAASLAPMLDLDASLAVFTSKFKLSQERERHIMQLQPESPNFAERLAALFGKTMVPETVADYRRMVREGRQAGLELRKRTIAADDFMPEKHWDVLAACGYMGPDPYSGAPGVEPLGDRRYRVTSRMATPRGEKRLTFTLRLQETMEQSRLVFNPLLNRFFYGENFRARAVRISDSGRIRNELQTLCSEALEYRGATTIRLHFDRIPPEVISPEQQHVLAEVLHWYKQRHPIWFSWLELVGT